MIVEFKQSSQQTKLGTKYNPRFLKFLINNYGINWRTIYTFFSEKAINIYETILFYSFQPS